MRVLPESYVKRHLWAVADEVCDDHGPTLVTRKGKPTVVVISLDDYNAINMTRTAPRPEPSESD